MQPPLSLLGLIALRRVSLLVLALLGLGAGLAVGYISPVTYTAQGQMLAGATSVSAAAVPSFTQAGQSLAQTYSRVFSGDRVQRLMIAKGFDPATQTATASPVADSSVILIETTADSPRAAVRSASAGIGALDTTVTALLDNSAAIARTRATLRTAYAQQSVADGARTALEKKKVKETAASYQKATADLGAAQATVGAARQLLADQVGASVQSNAVRPLTSAHITSSTSAKRYQLGASVGLIAGLGVWLLLAVLRARPAGRTTRGRDVA